MKRLILLSAPLAVAVLALANANAGTHDPARSNDVSASATRSVCHFRGTARRPYARLRVTVRQQRAHNRHAADIIPAPARCPRTRLTATSGGTAFTTTLVGETETPSGDPVGTGTATIRIRRGQGQVCFSIRVANITLPAVGAHIHRAAAGEAGNIVVQLRAPGANGRASGCVAAARSLVAQLLASPDAFYVNVHTTDFPAGAVRGQVGGGANAGTTLSTQLTGAQECNNAGQCGVGDPDGAGTAVVRFRPDAGLVCFDIAVQNIRLPSVGAHIHRGAAGSNGPIVVGFRAPEASGTSSGCVTAAAALINEIVANPTGFYVNVHTTDFPGGAIRGQLPAG